MNKRKLLISTTNSGKVKEIKKHLHNFPLEISSLLDLNDKVEHTEKGSTFEDNARGKCLFYRKFCDDLTLAEDSGLEIDYLNGAPGVFSARFAGPKATDRENIKKVLRLLKNVSMESRKARFVSYMVLSTKSRIIKEFQGSVEGFITTEQRGSSGFGYDPIFYYQPLKKTFGEMKGEEKNRVSHRGMALKQLEQFLAGYLNERIER